MNRRMALIAVPLMMLAIVSVWAQQGAPSGPPRGPGQDEHRPKPPLEQVLDANADGVIDAGEIANAPVSLKKLDKNGDGKLTSDEYRPPRPPRPDDQGPGH